MLNKLLISYFLACSIGGVMSYLIVPAGVNSLVVDFLVVLVIVFLGPFSTLLLGTLVPPVVLLPLYIIGFIGLALVVKAYKSKQ